MSIPFAWYWISMAAAVALLTTILWLSSMNAWHFAFYECNLLEIGTPWGYVVLSHEGYDWCTMSRWTGIEIGRPIPGDPNRLCRIVYKHELKRVYL